MKSNYFFFLREQDNLMFRRCAQSFEDNRKFWEADIYETNQIMDRSGVHMLLPADSIHIGNELYDELCGDDQRSTGDHDQ